MTDREKIANENLQKIANFTKENLPEGMGFVVLAFEFGMNADENRLMYVSNANREDVIDAMDEFKQKTKEQFGKHANAENKMWFDIDELMQQDLDNDTSIWCLNKLNYNDFLIKFGDLKRLVASHDCQQMKHYQFSIVGKGE